MPRHRRARIRVLSMFLFFRQQRARMPASRCAAARRLNMALRALRLPISLLRVVCADGSLRPLSVARLGTLDGWRNLVRNRAYRAVYFLLCLARLADGSSAAIITALSRLLLRLALPSSCYSRRRRLPLLLFTPLPPERFARRDMRACWRGVYRASLAAPSRSA